MTNIADLLTYKGMIGSVNFSEEDNCFFGSIQNIGDLYMYEGNNIRELTEMFHKSVDDYLEKDK